MKETQQIRIHLHQEVKDKEGAENKCPDFTSFNSDEYFPTIPYTVLAFK
jgi:hypothetical protein